MLQGTYALVGMALVLHIKLHTLAVMPVAQVAAALIAAHTASRWTSLPLIYCCTYVQVGGRPGALMPMVCLPAVPSTLAGARPHSGASQQHSGHADDSSALCSPIMQNWIGS